MNELTTTTTVTSSSDSFALVCGMEIHAELKTKSKMFCGCKNDPFGAKAPNTHTCPVCLGMPGGIPVANKTAIEWTIKLGLALGCSINLFSKFDRKHYFYPDLAKGYQISQYDLPFCYNGVVETSEGPVRIRRIHLEEDTGKLQHKSIEIDGKKEKVSLVDFNRCGVPLVEIVTEADIRSASQAKEYSKKIRAILRYLDIADCDMDQGGMRLEANVSLRNSDPKSGVVAEAFPLKDSDLPPYKVELKNINSFRFLEQAVSCEIERQAELLSDGTTPIQETRGWDSSANQTFSQRTKEDAEDYRYFPDPDLPPIRFKSETIQTWKESLPELPESLATRWQSEYGVEPRYTELLISSQTTATVLEEAFALLQKATGNSTTNAKVDPNTLTSDLVNKKMNLDLEKTTAQELADAVTKLHATQAVDTNKLEAVISEIIKQNPTEVARYKAGETKLLNFFIGQVMREMKQKVDVSVIRMYLNK